jgi:hypothetical protein
MENITKSKPRGKAGRPKKENPKGAELKPNEEVKPKIKLFDRHKYARKAKLQEDDTDDEDIIINLNEEEKEIKVLEVRRKKKRPERVRAGTKAPPRPIDAKPEQEKPDAKPEQEKPEQEKPDAKLDTKPEQEKPDTKPVAKSDTKPDPIGYISAGESGNLSDSSKMRQKLMVRHYPSGSLTYSASYGNPYNKFNQNQQYLIF